MKGRDGKACPQKQAAEKKCSGKPRQTGTTFENCEYNEKCQESKEDGCGNKLNKVADDEPNEKANGRWDEQRR